MAIFGNWRIWIPTRPARTDRMSILWLLLQRDPATDHLKRDDAVRAEESRYAEESDLVVTSALRTGREVTALGWQHGTGADRSRH